jgi:ornithine cyclodeaminase/alanine dehydrogenase-like protein (mu-crystallin family)
VKGECKRNAPDQITLFKSNGIALEDVAAAHYIYSRIKP